MLVGDPKQQLLCVIPLAIIADAISPASLTLKRFYVNSHLISEKFDKHLELMEGLPIYSEHRVRFHPLAIQPILLS